jgi:hypothetical protein
MIYGGEWPFQLITWLLNVLENDIGEVDEVMFQDFEMPCELFLQSGHRKKLFGRSRLSTLNGLNEP